MVVNFRGTHRKNHFEIENLKIFSYFHIFQKIEIPILAFLSKLT